MSQYKISRQTYGQRGQAPLYQQWELKDGSDTELQVTIQEQNSYDQSASTDDYSDIATLTSELFANIATFNYSPIIRTLFRDEKKPASIYYKTYNDTPLFTTLERVWHDRNLFANVKMPYSPAPTQFPTPLPTNKYTMMNAPQQFGESRYIDTRKFMTIFQRLRKYAGYPLTVSFYVTQEWQQTNSHHTYFMEDGRALRFWGGVADFPTDFGNHYTIDLDALKGVALTNSQGELYLRDDNGEIVTNQQGDPILLSDLDEGYTIYDTRTIIRKEAPQHPFYVRWINQMGGWDYWMFACRQTIQRSLTNTTTFSPYIDDNEAAKGDKITLRKECTESVAVSSGRITQDEWQAISRILYSPRIELFQGYDENQAEKWLTLTLDKGDAAIGTASPNGEIQLTFQLPTPQLQF